MAAIAGYGGIVTLSGLTAGVRSWVINTIADALETTTLASGQVRTYIAGLTGFSGSMQANFDSANTIAVGDSGTFTGQLGNSGALTYTGTIIITGIDNENTFDGVVTANVTFQGTGTLPTLSSSSSSG